MQRPVIFLFFKRSFNLVKFSILQVNFPICPSDFLAPPPILPPFKPPFFEKLLNSLIT
jgi:hypothetical protein